MAFCTPSFAETSYVIPHDKELAKEVNSARTFVTEMLKSIACENDLYGLGKLARFATADSYMNRFANPKLSMRNHRGGCLVINRVDGWKRNERNGLLFTATFVSESGGESVNTRFTLIKQDDGVWRAYF